MPLAKIPHFLFRISTRAYWRCVKSQRERKSKKPKVKCLTCRCCCRRHVCHQPRVWSRVLVELLIFIILVFMFHLVMLLLPVMLLRLLLWLLSLSQSFQYLLDLCLLPPEIGLAVRRAKLGKKEGKIVLFMLLERETFHNLQFPFRSSLVFC